MADETPSNLDPSNPSESPKPRKRRRWPLVLGVLFLLILALIALIPSIASTGMVRSIVLGKVNENLNGNVEIADWSLGWFSPTTVNGVKVYDDQKRLIADIPRIKLGLSVLGALKNNFALGDDNQIDIDSFIVHLDETGKTNLEKLPKSHKASAPKPAEPKEPAPKLPDISGKFTVNFRGTIEGSLVPVPVQIDPSNAIVTIANINKPIDSSVKLAYHVGDRPSSTFETSGSMTAVKDNILNIAELAGGQKIDLKNVDLAGLEPILRKFGVDAKLAGIVTGGIQVKAEGLTGLSADGKIIVQKLAFSGGPLGQDTFQTSQLSIPVKITRTSDPATKRDFIEFQNVGVKMDQATVSVTGTVTQQSLVNLSEGKGPGDDGRITIAADIRDLKDIAGQLKNTLRLQQGVSITGGSVHEQLNVALTKDQIRLEQNLKAEAQGQQGGRPIVLKPIEFSAGLSAAPTGKNQKLPDFHDLKLSLTSDFATFAGGGASLAKVDLNGKFDLGRLRSEVGQFADLGSIELQGTGDVAINTSGDVADANAPIDAKATMNLANVKVTGVANQRIDQDRLAVIASGILKRKDNAPIGVDKGYLSVTGGDPAAPMLFVQGSANLDLSSPNAIKAPWWEIKADARSLASLQQQYGGLVPALAQQNLKIDSGELHVTGAGSFDGQTALISQPLMLSIGSLGLSKGNQKLLSNETISANVAGSVTQASDKLAANFSALSLTSQSNLFNVNKSGDAPVNFVMLKSGAIQGNAAIMLAADLQRLANIAQGLSGEPPKPDQPQLRGGQLNGTISLAQAAQTKVDFNGQVTGLTVFAEGKNAIENEQISLALNATAPSDLNSAQPIAVAGKIGSSFVNTTLSDVKVLLNGGMYDMLQSATVDVQAPDLAKLYALAQSFTPAPAPVAPPAPVRGQPRQPAPPTPASPPVQITSGRASIKANIARDAASKTTTLNVTDFQFNQLAINRGQKAFGFARQPINAKLSAAVKADKQIDSIKVNDLAVNTGFVTVEMPQPIVIDSPMGAKPTYSGQIKVSGKFESITPLISLLQDADPLPYQGDYQLSQQIATKSDITSLNGAIDIKSFKVLDKAKKVAFTEDQVAIRNDVDLDLAKHNAAVKTLTVDMAQSKALGVKMTAQITDWETQRTISGLSSDPQAKLDLTYDLEKIWAIARPMLAPETQQEYKDLKIAGKYTKSFTVSGAYPDKPTFGQSIAALNADGSFAVELLDLPQGLTIKSFELPVAVKNGILQTLPAPRVDARRLTLTAPDAAGRRAGGAPRTREFIAGTGVANDGALGLDGMTLDLTQPDPLLSVTPKHVLLRDVKLNPVLADSLGSIGAIIMKDANKASGLTTVTIVKCEKVPLGGLIQKRQDSEAQIDLAVSNLVLDGPVPGVLSAVAKLGTDGIHGSIPTSTINLKNGAAQTDLTIQVDAQGTDARGRSTTRALPIKLVGGLGLQKLDLRNFTVTVDAELLPDEIRRVISNELVVPLRGTASKPQLDLQKALGENALRNLIPGNNGGSGNSGKGGDILDQILGGGKNSNPPPPRNRGR